MIVALLILIVLILLFGAAAVRSAIARILILAVAICIGGIGFATMRDGIGDAGPTYLWAVMATAVLVGGALLLAGASLRIAPCGRGLRGGQTEIGGSA